jgi:hypothetical protein
LALLLILSAIAFAAPEPQPAPLVIHELGKGSVELGGPWQFHLGDDPAFAAAALDDRTGQNGWEELKSDQSWGSQTHPGYIGVAWYRKHLHVSPATGLKPEFSLLLHDIDDAYELYWNGVLVGRNGKMPPHGKHYYDQPAQTFNLGEMHDGVLALRVWKQALSSFDSDQLGGFNATPVLGSPEVIAATKAEIDYEWLRGRQYHFAITTLYALVMVLSFLSWLRDRSQRVLLWMAVFCFGPVAAIFLYGLRLPFSWDFSVGWGQPVLALQDIGLWFLLLWLLELDENRWLTRITRGIAVVNLISASLDGSMSLLDWSNPAITAAVQLADAIFTAITTIAEFWPLVLLAYAARKRLDPARWAVAISAFLMEMILVVRVAATQGVRFTHWTLGQRINLPLFTVLGNAFTAATLAQTALLFSIIYAVYRNAREEHQRRTEMEQELKSASELQQVLIPESLPSISGYAVTSAYRPAQEVGGDFFQIISIERDGRNSSLIILGDVSGKGLRAAMSVSFIVGTARTLAERHSSPAEILSGINRGLQGRLRGGFATCLVVRLDGDGRCVLSNAGHCAPFLNEHEIQLPGVLPLGVVADARYEEHAIQLRTGDHLVLYTDGLLEARTNAGELFSFERLTRLMARHPNAEQALAEAQTFGQQDDITVLTVTRLAAGAESSTQFIAPPLAKLRAIA